mmetsp:Transcript_23161/g.72558  ORF Transcript_23161/g.72558 Transcript_23161/m.72558 type:complete len:185 (-) Transcript_23161:2074-2628(-)
MATAPTGEQLRATRVETRELVLKSRAGNGTDLKYGDTEGTRGLTKHWFAWCRAGPGETVYGVTMPDDKRVFNGAVHPHTVEVFLSTWVVKRPKLTRRGKPIAGTEGQIGNEALRQYVKTLRDLYLGQRNDPRYASQLAGVPQGMGEQKQIMQAHSNNTAKRREAQHQDMADWRPMSSDYNKSQH